jgi:hypothetical protein
MHAQSSIIDLLLGPLADTYLMIPILFVLYIILDYFSHTKQLDLISRLKIPGPIILVKDRKFSYALQALLVSLTAALLWRYLINYFF